MPFFTALGMLFFVFVCVFFWFCSVLTGGLQENQSFCHHTKRRDDFSPSERQFVVGHLGHVSPKPVLPFLAIGARDAGNEKWNDPEENHPGFL